MLRPVRSKSFLPVVAQGEAYSFGSVSTGYWLAENQIVWDVLAPILRIASRILDDTLTVPVVRAYFLPSSLPKSIIFTNVILGRNANLTSFSARHSIMRKLQHAAASSRSSTTGQRQGS